ncbi:MAG TPA: cupin domain-containing protein [Chloroflexota bacterium]|nr:cupin domain-containing protein [Chloroflexota bacterium]
MPSAADTAPVVERIDPYEEWRQREEVPLVGGIYIRDMKKVEVGPWPRKGVNGALCYLDGDDEQDEHIVEIPPGGKTIPEHHLYDEAIYVVSGRGTASVWFDEKRKQTFEWGEGSFFVLPTNMTYQFFNMSGSEPARYFSVTNLPALMRQFHNEDFIFDCPFAFTDRYSGSDDYFNGEGKLYRGRLWETNFVADIRKMKLFEWKERGGGGTNAFFMLAGGTINSHVSRFQPGTYKKGHKHGPGAHLYIIQGEGYVLTQREKEERIRCDWSEGSLYLSGAGPGLWHHQHFNVGATPAAYLVLGVNKSRRLATSRWNAATRTDKNLADVSAKEGGWQTEYEDEDPEVHRIFEAELAKRGVTCRMKNLVPWCTGEVGPTQQGEWGDEH